MSCVADDGLPDGSEYICLVDLTQRAVTHIFGTPLHDESQTCFAAVAPYESPLMVTHGRHVHPAHTGNSYTYERKVKGLRFTHVGCPVAQCDEPSRLSGSIFPLFLCGVKNAVWNSTIIHVGRVGRAARTCLMCDCCHFDSRHQHF